MTERGFEHAKIPVGEEFWRGLGRNGALIAGYVLVAIHVVIMSITMLWAPHMSYRAQDRWDDWSLWSTIFGPIFAMTLIWIGELIRRGDWNSTSSDRTNTVYMRMVPLAWHWLWGLIALGTAGAMLWATWEYPYADAGTVGAVNGIMAAGAAGAILGSGVKKAYWFRAGRARQLHLQDTFGASPDRNRNLRRAKFWRLVGFRWRYDLWSVALGMVAMWIAGWALVTRDIYTSSTDSATLAGVILLGVGLTMVVWGLWGTTQFWRCGEDLAAGESLS